MSFSDEHLKALKEGLEDSDDWQAFNMNCNIEPKDIQALLARLEAAEAVCEHQTRGAFIRYGYNGLQKAYDAWLKSKGTPNVKS